MMIDHFNRPRCEKRRAALVLALAFALSATSRASAEVFSPRVVDADRPDVFELRTLAHDPSWAKLTDNAFAEGLFRWLTDDDRGLRLVERAPWEGTDKLAEFATVADPLKTLAVYGYGDRRALAGAFAATWEASGRGRACLTVVDGQLIAEVEYGGQRHAFDVAGKMAVTPATSKPRYHAVPTGHTLEFVLRRGERFTRWFQPQGDRWQMTDAEGKDKKLCELWDKPPRGPKAKDDSTRSLVAHGQFVYEPNLKDDPADFRDGVYNADNVEVTGGGLTLAKTGEGFAIFAVQSPYIIVPELGKLEDPKDDHDASVVELDAAEVTVTYSKDYGATWLGLETKMFPARLDLTQQVGGSYGYLLRVDLKGQPGKSVVRSLKITTWVQVAPGLLPAVRPGKNTFTLKTGDAEGKPTFPVVVDASTADENGFLRPVIRPPREYNPGHANRRVIGPFTARVAASPRSSIAWLTVGGSFACDPKQPQAAQVKLGYALERPAGFLTIDVSPLPADQSHEHFHLDVPIALEQPAGAVYLQCEGQPALNQFRVTAHCVRDEPRPSTPLKITHRWKEGETPREHSVELTDRGEYSFEAGAELVNDSIEFAVGGWRK